MNLSLCRCACGLQVCARADCKCLRLCAGIHEPVLRVRVVGILSTLCSRAGVVTCGCL